MKKLILFSVAVFFTYAGVFAQKAGRVDTVKHATYYSCPTHPEVTGHEPGKCSKCGMELNLSSKDSVR